MSTAIDDILQQGLPALACSKALNALGKTFFEQQDIENAIRCWEKSVECYGKPGFAQAQLMKAYNIRRRECAQAGDSDGAERYAQKIDDLMQQSKDAIRYGF
ncbi:hypothetical protein B4923_18750 [Brenneria roseae subsp. americana]|uniref:Tetratricopeptide repeat protein n=1 Tax=Brenneria roseae subsp. americana TaxID=1508507 RepID=A0A2U1TK18_9GAMM|nr:hypothetical protein [Brenneria roseae]PWC09756.1 hypothetical protein B4923_18750 [Brenneria roseae subsp. americana]